MYTRDRGRAGINSLIVHLVRLGDMSPFVNCERILPICTNQHGGFDIDSFWRTSVTSCLCWTGDCRSSRRLHIGSVLFL